MNRVGRQGAAARLVGLLLLLALVTAAVSGAFAAAGRTPGQAIAGGCGVVGVAIVLLGTVLLGLARRSEGRVTQVTGLGTLALSVPFLVIALVV
ncbi:MAG: hypothetical protein ACR2J9_01265 [Gaiellales bacterium]